MNPMKQLVHLALMRFDCVHVSLLSTIVSLIIWHFLSMDTKNVTKWTNEYDIKPIGFQLCYGRLSIHCLWRVLTHELSTILLNLFMCQFERLVASLVACLWWPRPEVLSLPITGSCPLFHIAIHLITKHKPNENATLSIILISEGSTNSCHMLI